MWKYRIDDVSAIMDLIALANEKEEGEDFTFEILRVGGGRIEVIVYDKEGDVVESHIFHNVYAAINFVEDYK